MDTYPVIIGISGFVFLFLFMASGLPIAFSFLTVGFVGTIFLSGLPSALGALGRIPFTWASEYVFTCIPLFIFSGLLIANTGIAKDLFAVAFKWVGRLPGGLAMATTAGVGIFSAISGSSTACAASMSAVCYPEMKRYNYDPTLAAGCIAAGGGIDLMIPPSIGFVVYGILTEESIGKLLIAGIIPGIIQVASFFITIYAIVKLTPDLAPLRPEASISWGEKLRSLGKLWSILFLFLLIMGGIYSGYFTPIEAGAVGSAGTIMTTLASRRLTWKVLIRTVCETLDITVIILTLIFSAMVFNLFIAMSELPRFISAFLARFDSPMTIVGIILFFYLPLGMIMEATSMILLTIPLYLPFLIMAHVDLIWFGVLQMMMVEIALITPPVGLNVYVVHGVIKEVPMEKIFYGMIPFLMADIVVLFLLIFVPKLSLFLPSLMIK